MWSAPWRIFPDGKRPAIAMGGISVQSASACPPLAVPARLASCCRCRTRAQSAAGSWPWGSWPDGAQAVRSSASYRDRYWPATCRHRAFMRCQRYSGSAPPWTAESVATVRAAWLVTGGFPPSSMLASTGGGAIWRWSFPAQRLEAPLVQAGEPVASCASPLATRKRASRSSMMPGATGLVRC